MTDRLSLSRCIVTFSICLLVALFAVLPPSLLFSTLSSGQSPSLKFTKPSRIHLDGGSSTPLAFPGFAFAPLATPSGAAFEFGYSDTIDRRGGVAQLSKLLDRLRRLFWTFAQRWQALLQQPGLTALFEANFPHKGKDMLESAA
ncbi:hypothetical protein [Baaleninema sp.]|uniref:hypothetical protein n=1 Tax=Baaleninema sp. TaxID=3101197 RepID=UPI003D07BA1F